MAILVEEAIGVTLISQEELAERVAILQRFRTLLSQQRDRFRNYLAVLDKQQNIIESGDAGELLAYVEMEEQIVTDIFSIQKVIDPLEDMYHAVISRFGGDIAAPADDVPNLKATLEDLKNEAILRSSRNRELLSSRMTELRSEITVLRNNPFTARARRSVYSRGSTASLIDIQG